MSGCVARSGGVEGQGGPTGSGGWVVKTRRRTEAEARANEFAIAKERGKTRAKAGHEARGLDSEPEDHASLPCGYTLRVGRDGERVRLGFGAARCPH